ncbi:MAG: hypothetical protein ABIP81_01645, partial [Terriglobales bacterium]
MKNFGYIFVALAVTTATLAAAAQSSDQNLPAAPSSTLAKPAPTPPAKPAEKPAEAKPGAPVLESLDSGKKKPQPVAPLEPPKDSALPARPAQDAATRPKTGEAEPGDITIKARAEEVNVIFTVTDRRGRFIKDLKREDFAIIDDKRPAEAVRGFSAETNLPLRVGLLVD